MRIAHLCLSCFYIDGHGYQENDLVRQHVRDGHDVLVLASTETFTHDGKLTYVPPADYAGADGARVIRLPYRRWLPHALMRKLRINAGVEAALETFRPDAILFHGTCGWELRTAARYVSRHPEVIFYIDSHEDWNNSARGAVSRELLHRRYYGPILRSVLPQVRKILCVTLESIDFVHDLYGVPGDRLEFYPLGGYPIDDAEYAERRDRERQALGLPPDAIAIVQSGKQTRRKKLLESLRAFTACPDPRLRFLIAGLLSEDIKAEAEALIAADARIRFLGWKSREQLTDLLCAADVYLQPGTQSATMQHSLCCRCAVILDDVPAHVAYKSSNGWFLNCEGDLDAALAAIPSADLTAMKAGSSRLATELLDYRLLSRRVLM